MAIGFKPKIQTHFFGVFMFGKISKFSNFIKVPVTTNFHEIFRNTISWSYFVA